MTTVRSMTVADLTTRLAQLPQDAVVVCGANRLPVLSCGDPQALLGDPNLRDAVTLEVAEVAEEPALRDYVWLQSLSQAQFERLSPADRETLSQISRDYGAARCAEECGRMLRCRRLRLPYVPLGRRFRASRVS